MPIKSLVRYCQKLNANPKHHMQETGGKHVQMLVREISDYTRNLCCHLYIPFMKLLPVELA